MKATNGRPDARPELRARLWGERVRFAAMRHSTIALLAVFLGGCLSPEMTIDARSALEQELTRTAIARAVDHLAIHKAVLQGTWNVAVSAPDSRDRGWIESCLRERLVELGARVSREEKAGLPTVEARVVMAGSDVDNFSLGLPISLSRGYQTTSFYQSITQYGRARMRLTFWTSDDALLTRSPEIYAKANVKKLFFLTVGGPFTLTDLQGRTWGRLLEIGEDSWREVRESKEWIVPAEGKSSDS